MKEREIIEAIRKAFPSSGIGNDAAIVKIGGQKVCFSIDAAVEGVHFKRIYSTLAQAVQKLISANVSDVNAVGGRARGFLLTAGLPEGFGDYELEDILSGLRSAASFYSIELEGGDTVLSPGRYFFDIFIHGILDVGTGMGRKGAEPGDLVVLFGTCGASAVGLKLLEEIFTHRKGSSSDSGVRAQVASLIEENREEIVKRIRNIGIDYSRGVKAEHSGELKLEHIIYFVAEHLVPVAKPIPRSFLVEHAGDVHAAIDVSDGLAIDLWRLATESGVGAKLEEGTVPIPNGIEYILEGERELLLDTVLSSGEEYCMLAAVSADSSQSLPDGSFIIGEFTKERGISIVDSSGVEKPLDIKGFEHTF